VKIRLGNEFGLWRRADWASAVGSEADVALQVCVLPERGVAALEVCEPGVAALEVSEPRPLMSRTGAVDVIVTASWPGTAQVRVACHGWHRPALAVVTLPIRVVGKAEGEFQPADVAPSSEAAASSEGAHSALARLARRCGATSCRELAFGDGNVMVAEAPGDLGIAGKLWDAAFSLATLIRDHHAPEFKGANVLELGCGIGAVGLACAAHAPRRVWLSDVAQVLPLLDLNIYLNRPTSEPARALALDWFAEALPAELLEDPPSIVIASDVVYDPTLHQPLLSTLEKLFALHPPPELVLLAHRHRNPHDADFFGELHRRFDARRIDDHAKSDAPADAPSETPSASPAASDAFIASDVLLFRIRRRGS